MTVAATRGTGTGGRRAGGTVDYLCNAFGPERAAAWDAAIAAQGLTLKIRRAADDSFTDPDDMVARMDLLGIATLIVAASDPEPHPSGFAFSDVAASLAEVDGLARRHPGRFAALWTVSPERGMAGVVRAEDALADDRVVGLYVHTHSHDRRFDHADYYPFYARADRVGVPVVMQAGVSGGRMPSESGRPIGIDRPALYFPDVNFVLSHTGWPWTDEAVAMALKFTNVYLGTASYPPRRWPPAVVDFLCHAGRSKVLFGTNFPTVGHRHALDQLGHLGLDDAVRHGLLEGNARAIFGRL
jgi:predicted TIM-barrel fold metal-dependent hydrolase